VAKKISSPEELRKIRDKVRIDLDPRTGAKEVIITVHMGTCGIAAGAREILGTLADELEQASARNVTLRQAGCLGLCDREPMVTLADKTGNEFRYGPLDDAKARRVVKEHVVGGNPVQDCLIKA